MINPPPGWQVPHPQYSQHPQQHPQHPQQQGQPLPPQAQPMVPPPMPPQPMPPQAMPPQAQPMPPYPQQLPPRQRRQNDENTVAIFAYVGLLASFIVPLILYLIKKNESPYARHHGAQALNLALTSLGYTLVAGVFGAGAPLVEALHLPVRWLPVVFLILFYLVVAANGITYLIFLIVGAVKASGGQYYRMPAWRCWPMVR